MSMKIFYNTIGNQTRHLPACSAVSQPTAPRSAPHIIVGKIEVRGRRGRRRVKLLDDLKEMRGHWIFKYEALDRTVWKTRFQRGHGTGTSTKHNEFPRQYNATDLILNRYVL
jgi:hypothetical protein